MTLARLMIAFAGTELPPSAARRISEQGVAGVTLFHVHNVDDPPQIRRLTAAIQEARPAGAPPLLVAADQEGGQLVGLGEGTTPFAGAMALGAAGDEALAERVAGATARELRALGVNVDYAPVCDVASNPANPGARDPQLRRRPGGRRKARGGDRPWPAGRGRGRDGQALPGRRRHGSGSAPRAAAGAAGRTRSWPGGELVPFRAALEAGARMVMTGHLVLAGQDDDLPTSLSAAVLRDLLRGRAAVRRRHRHRCPGHARPGPGIGADRRRRRRPPCRRGRAARDGGRAGPRAAGRGPRTGAAARPHRCRRRRGREAPAGRAAPLAGPPRPAAARRRRVRRAPGTRRRAGPAVDHPRPQRRPAVAVEAGRRRADRRRPVDARGPDAGRHVLDGAADAGIGAPPPARGRGGDPPAGGAGRGRHRGSRRAALGLRPRRRRDVLRAPPAGAGGAGRGGPGVRHADRHRRPAHAVGSARLPVRPNPRLQLRHPAAVDGGAGRRAAGRGAVRRPVARRRSPVCIRAVTGSRGSPVTASSRATSGPRRSHAHQRHCDARGATSR